MTSFTDVKLHSVRCNPFLFGLDATDVWAVTLSLTGDPGIVATDPNLVISAIRAFPGESYTHPDVFGTVEVTGHLLLVEEQTVTVFFRAYDKISAQRFGSALAEWGGGGEVAYTVTPASEVTWKASVTS